MKKTEKIIIADAEIKIYKKMDRTGKNHRVK